MPDPFLIMSVDLGTTALKTCLYEIGDRLVLRAAASRKLGLETDSRGRAEQDPEEWWSALASSIPEVLASARVLPEAGGALTFCAQMQCLVLVDESGAAVRPALSYLDSRATARRRRLCAGGPRVAGIGVGLILPWLAVAGGVAASAKDPLWKYLRVAEEEPAAFARVHRWLDAKDFLTARCTGRFTMSADSAFATFLADTRKDKVAWSPWLVRRFGIEARHLPEIVGSGDEIGRLRKDAASSLGLKEGTPVFAGGGDATLIGTGAGA
jgi:xylulokinase